MPEFGRSRILTAWLHVTNACNLRCPYCCLHKTPEGTDTSVGRASIDAVVRSAVAHRLTAVKLKYAGGEASLNHRLLLSLHDYATAAARNQAPAATAARTRPQRAITATPFSNSSTTFDMRLL